jgi:hypothetical protein
MKANELRIGNWYQNHKGEYQQITPRFFSSLAGGLSWEDQKAAGYSELSGYFHPIPLSPEILEKCGFKDEYGNGRYYFDGFEYYNGKLWFRTAEIKIQYLHQLQNLYFALTGEELEVNLTVV